MQFRRISRANITSKTFTFCLIDRVVVGAVGTWPIIYLHRASLHTITRHNKTNKIKKQQPMGQQNSQLGECNTKHTIISHWAICHWSYGPHATMTSYYVVFSLQYYMIFTLYVVVFEKSSVVVRRRAEKCTWHNEDKMVCDGRIVPKFADKQQLLLCGNGGRCVLQCTSISLITRNCATHTHSVNIFFVSHTTMTFLGGWPGQLTPIDCRIGRNWCTVATGEKPIWRSPIEMDTYG